MDDNMDIDHHPKVLIGGGPAVYIGDFPPEINRVCDQTFTSPEQLVYKIVTDDKAFYGKEEVLILVKKLIKMFPNNSSIQLNPHTTCCSYIS